MIQNYFVLLVIGSIIALISFILPIEYNWWKDILINISAGFYSSTLIYFLIERSLENARTVENEKRIRIAYKRFRKPISDQIYLLAKIFKACTSKLDNVPNTLETLFDENFLDNMRFLNFLKNAPIIPNSLWMFYIQDVNTRFKEQVDNIIDTYAGVFEPDFLDDLENLSNSNIILMSRNFRSMHGLIEKRLHSGPFYIYMGASELMKEHIRLLVKVVSVINSSLDVKIGVPESVFKDNMSPEWNSGRD